MDRAPSQGRPEASLADKKSNLSFRFGRILSQQRLGTLHGPATHVGPGAPITPCRLLRRSSQIRNPLARGYGQKAGSFSLGQTDGRIMTLLLRRLWTEDKGQDVAEYAVMLAVILVIVIGTVQLIGSNANAVFSSVASAIQ